MASPVNQSGLLQALKGEGLRDNARTYTVGETWHIVQFGCSMQGPVSVSMEKISLFLVCVTILNNVQMFEAVVHCSVKLC